MPPMPRINILIEYAILLTLALTAGAAASFAFAPYHWWGLLIPAYSGLYLLLNRSNTFRGGFGFGWIFGFALFVFSLSWIGNALLVEGNPYAWAYPLAVCALPAGLAFFPAIACGIATRFLKLSTIPGFLGLCALLGLSEWLRGHIFTGFPWNLPAYAFGANPPLLQAVSLIDIYSLSLFIILLATAPGLCALHPKKVAPWAIATGLGVLLIGFYAYGYQRLSHAPMAMHEDISIKIIQPDTPQHEKWDSAKLPVHFEELVQLSFAMGDEAPGKTTLIVWPETALHYQYVRDPNAMRAMQEMLKSYPGPAALIAGTILKDPETGAYTNSVLGIDATGTVQTRYDKFHLVPFGEYIPFQNLIGTAIPTITKFSGFERGPGPQTQELILQGRAEPFRFSPLVCYEILFPGAVVDHAAARPQVIVNVTNDGWYGFSAGPHQHLLKAVFRAVEEGVPVIRAANNGISAVIDPYGRVLTQSDLFVEGVYNSPLPLNLP